MPSKQMLHHLPDVPNPSDSICFQVEVPNDPWHIRAFLGQLNDLGAWWTWERDEAHTALIAAQVWQKIVMNLYAGCNIVPPGGIEVEDMSRFRVDPDNNCILQIECGPDQWETFWDISDCIQASTGQPGPGGDTPAPGTSKNRCLKLQANGQVILPFPVTDGQLITLSALEGGWTDGSGAWFCPDGEFYSLGECGSGCAHEGGDLSGDACHMSIVALINGIYYPTNSPITVPSGTGTVDCVFMANDATPADNFGEIGFCVSVETPETAPITITYLVGSGPSSCRVGDLVSIVFVNEGPDNGASYQFSECVQVSVVGYSGWHGPSSSDWTYFDCASASHGGPGGVTDPTTFPAHTCVTKMNWGTGPGATTNITIRIEAVCP